MEKPTVDTGMFFPPPTDFFFIHAFIWAFFFLGGGAGANLTLSLTAVGPFDHTPL
jgi:hypothetical protein